MLDIVTQGIAEGRINRINASSGLLGHNVPPVIDIIGVGTKPPNQCVGTLPTIENVVDVVTNDEIGAAVAGSARCATHQYQIFEPVQVREVTIN